MADETENAQSKGGKARAAKLSPEERKTIAVAAAEARWGKELPIAQYPGVLKIVDMAFPCAVLSDKKTRVLTQSNFMRGMGMYYSGWVAKNQPAEDRAAEIPQFLSFKALRPFVERHLGELQSIVVKYRTLNAGVAHGIRAEIIPKICEVWLDADEAVSLPPRQKLIAAKAKVIMRGLAHVGITALVDEATGFQDIRPRDALAKILEAFVQTELRKWVRTFPPEYFEQLCRLRGVAYPPPGMKLPPYFGHLTNDIVYNRLAPGVKDRLKHNAERSPTTGRHKHKLFQYLTEDVGDPKLREHLGKVTALMTIAPDYDSFETFLDRVAPRWDDTLPLPLNEDWSGRLK
jgi:hypothetical protein